MCSCSCRARCARNATTFHGPIMSLVIVYWHVFLVSVFGPGFFLCPPIISRPSELFDHLKKMRVVHLPLKNVSFRDSLKENYYIFLNFVFCTNQTVKAEAAGSSPVSPELGF